MGYRALQLYCGLPDKRAWVVRLHGGWGLEAALGARLDEK